MSRTARAEVKLEPNRVTWVRFEDAGVTQSPASGEEPVTSEPTTPAEPVEEPVEPAVSPEPVEPAKDSVIGGTVAYPADSGLSSDGLLLLLTCSDEVRQTAVANGRYAFFGLPAGAYRLAVLPADSALSDLAVRENIVLDGVNQFTVDFELPVPTHYESRVTGRAKGGVGRMVLLEGPLTDDAGVQVGSLTTAVSQDENLRV